MKTEGIRSPSVADDEGQAERIGFTRRAAGSNSAPRGPSARQARSDVGAGAQRLHSDGHLAHGAVPVKALQKVQPATAPRLVQVERVGRSIRVLDRGRRE